MPPASPQVPSVRARLTRLLYVRMLLWTTLSLCAILATTAALNLPSVPKDFTATDEVLSAISDDIANKFAEEYLAYRKTGLESAALRQISAQLAKSHSKKDIFTKELDELSAADQFFLCTTCRATVHVGIRMVREEDGELNGPNAEHNARLLAMDFCRRLDMQTDEVCLGLFESNWPTIEYIAHESTMDSRTFCSLFMEFNFCNVKNPEYNWTLTVDPTGAPVTGPKADVPKSGADNIAVLHISDLHYDPLYEPDSLAECPEPLCCQRHKDQAQGTSKAAGYWADYRDCDAPWHMIENAFEHIKKTHTKIDYIYHTGDFVDHMVWETSIKKNTEVISKIDNKLAEVFPGIPVYPCIGNHEPHPLNVFSPDNVPKEVSTTWLYEHLYQSWSKWLPASTKDTILKGGYYTALAKPGFRIIALNNNDCYSMNWWLYYSGTNKQPQLQWLHDTLLAAEKANELVHILAHIPAGDAQCWSVWSRAFNKMVERYRNTISGIFNGHSHRDEMHMHYSENGHAVGIVWNGGSITPASNKNPNYRFYELESSTMQVAEAETWIFNLTLANERGKEHLPEWYKMYDFRTEFTTDTSPNGINKLYDVFAEEPEMLRKFWRYQMTMADPRLNQGCGRSCLMAVICRMSTTVNTQKNRCHELQAKLTKALDAEDLTSTTTTTTAEPPEEDGAASIAAFSLTTIMAIHIFVKHLL